jgi:hypothetical protein
MPVNMFVWNVNAFVNSCKFLYNCKQSSVINLIWNWQVVYSYTIIDTVCESSQKI